MNKKPAYSLIYALVIMTVIMVVAASANRGTRNALEKSVERLDANTNVKNAAESAVGKAILAIKEVDEAGYEPDDYSETSSDGKTTLEYSVISRAQKNSNDSTYYYTPIPGTGTAAPSSDCDVRATNDEDVEHPCNWNKLMYGRSVTIPLYSYDENTGTIKNPYDLGLTSWNLKIRTPCEDSGVYSDDCDGGDRYELDGVSTDYENDDSIILWQLIGEDSSGDNVVSVVPDDDTTKSRGLFSRTASPTNTEIYESLINDAADSLTSTYSVLSTDSPTDTTIDATTYDNLLDLSRDTNIEKLYLQISIVSPLKTSTGSVPYLEWQLESQMSGGAFADNKAIIIGWGYYESSLGRFGYPYIISRGTVGERANMFTISN